MIIAKAVLTSFISACVMFVLTKLTGNKQISQMSMFDYIAGITIGSSGAEMAIGGEVFLPSLVATVFFGVMAYLISVSCNKSVKARRFLNGEPIILYKNGTFYRKNMARVRMDMGEFLTQCRNNGNFSLRDISCVIMETSGKVSFMKTLPDGTKLPVNVILDGKILKENLEMINKNEWWLMNELDRRKLKLSEIMLGTLENSKLCLYPFCDEPSENIFNVL